MFHQLFRQSGTGYYVVGCPASDCYSSLLLLLLSFIMFPSPLISLSLSSLSRGTQLVYPNFN